MAGLPRCSESAASRRTCSGCGSLAAPAPAAAPAAQDVRPNRCGRRAEGGAAPGSLLGAAGEERTGPHRSAIEIAHTRLCAYASTAVRNGSSRTVGRGEHLHSAASPARRGPAQQHGSRRPACRVGDLQQSIVLVGARADVHSALEPTCELCVRADAEPGGQGPTRASRSITSRSHRRRQQASVCGAGGRGAGQAAPDRCAGHQAGQAASGSRCVLAGVSWQEQHRPHSPRADALGARTTRCGIGALSATVGASDAHASTTPLPPQPAAASSLITRTKRLASALPGAKPPAPQGTAGAAALGAASGAGPDGGAAAAAAAGAGAAGQLYQHAFEPRCVMQAGPSRPAGPAPPVRAAAHHPSPSPAVMLLQGRAFPPAAGRRGGGGRRAPQRAARRGGAGRPRRGPGARPRGGGARAQVVPAAAALQEAARQHRVCLPQERGAPQHALQPVQPRHCPARRREGVVRM